MADYPEIFSMTARLITPPGEKAKFSDADIWQFIKIGIRRVQQFLRARNVNELTGRVDITVNAGTSAIDASQLGAYGFITKPLRLWERPSTDTNGWLGMRFMNPLPVNIETGDYFRFWDYQRLDRVTWQIQFPAACGAAMVVRVEGPCSIFIDNSTSNQPYFLNGTMEPVAFFAASLAAQASGRDGLESTLERQGMEFVDGLIAEDIHQRQLDPARMYAVRNGLRDRFW